MNAVHATRLLTEACFAGQSVVIAGPGPSLADEWRRLPVADQIWACNSALSYLVDRGVRVTHGFAIDQHPAMLDDHEWQRTFDVEYLVASSVHPSLAAHLLGCGRRLTFFHNYLGVPDPEGWEPTAHDEPAGTRYEHHLYRTRFGNSIVVGHGLNAVPRAVCLAIAVGFSRIMVVGADCACCPDSPPMPPIDTPEYADWMHGLVMYADGRTASQYGEQSIMAEAADLCGRRWVTRPDMVISARHLLELEAAYPANHITLIGETLPNALRGQSAEWWEGMPRLTNDGVVVGFGDATALHGRAA